MCPAAADPASEDIVMSKTKEGKDRSGQTPASHNTNRKPGFRKRPERTETSISQKELRTIEAHLGEMLDQILQSPS